MQMIAVLSFLALGVSFANQIFDLTGIEDRLSLRWLFSVVIATWAAAEGYLLYRHKIDRSRRNLLCVLCLQSFLILLQPLVTVSWGEDALGGLQMAFEGMGQVSLTMVLLMSAQSLIFVVVNGFIIWILAEEEKEKARRLEFQMLASLNALSLRRDNETGNHILRTQQYVRLLARRIRDSGHYVNQLTDHVIDSLFKAAPLHDIGKVGVPDQILRKPGKLSNDEWHFMQAHTLIGESVLRAAEAQVESEEEVIAVAIQLAGSHHEKWDGSGYPRGLTGDRIPLGGRIMALADVYDALVNSRAYKRAWTHDEAVQEISRGRGTDFDPVVFDAFIAEQDRFRKIALNLRDEKAQAGEGTLEFSLPNFKPRTVGRAEERFRILFQNSPIGMAMIDHQSGQFIHVNEALSQYTGYTRPELLNLSFWDITPSKYLGQEATQVDELDRTGRFGPVYKEYIRKDGTRFPIKLSGFMLVEDDGRKLVWGIIEDISRTALATQVATMPGDVREQHAPSG
jgi:PAS domain S-box-containing protein